MLIQSPELINQIAEWKRKSIDGTLTLEDQREAIKVLRGNRVAAITAAGEAKRATKSKTPVKAAADLLNDLENF